MLTPTVPAVMLLDRILAGATRIARWGALAGGTLLLAGALLVACDVLLRKLAGRSIGGADELSGYSFAIGTAWAFAFVLLERGNVRVDALYQHLPAMAARVLDVLALLALGAFALTVATYGWTVVAQSVRLAARSNSALSVPLALPQALWWGGWAFFVLVIVLLLLRVVAAAIGGDGATMARLAGARSTAEEAREEFDNARAAAGLRGDLP
ncbi:MAG: TRAP transporter small permease subunit [Betaproteobacteria bacterium]